MAEYKECSKCGQEKNIDRFSKDSSKKDGMYSSCKDCKKIVNDKYYKENIDVRKKCIHEHYIKNKDEIIKRKLEQRRRNKKVYNKKRNEYRNKRKKENPEYKLLCNIRARLYNALKRNSKSKSTERLLGCSVEEFKDYIERQFTNKMNWDNYGSYWHIDHIIPCSHFDFSKPHHQEECFFYTNMQPLEAIENIKKGGSLNYGN